ncbi:MAG TPA: TerC/Alx family metal homeostasis membrane protein [Thermoanaerobaculaceae bacterium]|nr:TerC/Alx family metal homeostasis membrane protein [Thermoanaerobaculaceae bacterium]
MTGWSWLVFGAVVALLLALDLGVFHRHSRHESTRRALLWSLVWVGLGLGFSLFVAAVRGQDAALAYLTAYLIEESLSVDNLFVFLALFTYFGVAAEHQHRVLFWGIVGAIVFRGLFIFAGVALINRFHWVIYILGVLLVATGAKLGLGEAEQVHPERNLIVRWASRVLPMVKSFHGERFAVKTESGLRFTPLLLVLLAIESTDVMFAVDSVPAVLAVSRDVFVVYTSNIFAVLGLRALYFVLAGALRSLRLLRPALAIILVLVGVKMLLSEVVEIPTGASLAGVAAILAAATAGSLLFPPRGRKIADGG